MLPGHVTPFWKAFAEENNNVRADFDFGPIPALAGYAGTYCKGGHNSFVTIKQTPWNQILRNFNYMQLFHTTSPGGPTASIWSPKIPCTRNASPLRLLVLPGCDMPFWKKLDKLSKCVIVDFWSGLVFPSGSKWHLSILGYKRYQPIMLMLFSHIVLGALGNNPRMPWSGSRWQFCTLEY